MSDAILFWFARPFGEALWGLLVLAAFIGVAYGLHFARKVKAWVAKRRVNK